MFVSQYRQVLNGSTHSVVPQNVLVSWSLARSGLERPKSQSAT